MPAAFAGLDPGDSLPAFEGLYGHDMTLLASPPTPTVDPPKPRDGARISFRQPVSDAGFVDAGWSPRVDILVVPPDTDPAVAERALALASSEDSNERPGHILELGTERAL